MSDRQPKQGRPTAMAAPRGVDLPANTEMERSLLGFILADPKTLSDMLDILRPDDFNTEQHRQVYEAFIDLYSTQELTADVNLLAKKLVGTRVFADIPAAKGFISNLLDPAVMSNHMYALQYAEEIHSLAVQRALVRLSWEIPALVKEGVGDSLMEVMDAVERRVFEVTHQDRERNQGLVRIGDCLDALEGRLEQLTSGNMLPNGLPTGIESVDDYLSGFKPGDLAILAARPAQGKTAVSLNIAHHVAFVQKMPVAVFSLEMGRDQLAERMAASVARVNLNGFYKRYLKVNSGQCSHQEKDSLLRQLVTETRRLRAAKEHIRKLPLLVDDTAGINVLQISAACRRLASDAQRTYGAPLGLVIIDYLQLMQPVTKRAGSNRQEEVAEMSRGLKLMAKEIEVPLLCLSQLNRSVESRADKRPVLSDLRESGAIEQDADIVMFINRPHSGEAPVPGETKEQEAVRNMQGEIIIAKHRTGPIGDAHVLIDDRFTLFRSVPKGVSVSSIEGFIQTFWRKVHQEGDIYYTVPEAEVPVELAEFRRPSAEAPATQENIAAELGLDEPEPAPEVQAAPVPTGSDDAYFDKLVQGRKSQGASTLLDDFLDDDEELLPDRLEEA